MNVYLSVSTNPPLERIAKIADVGELNILCSYEYRKAMGKFKPQDCKRFIADSGAFTAMNAGKLIDDEYVLQYAQWLKENDIDQYIEMDLDEIFGYEKTLQYRKMLETITGKPCIPCWHVERGAQGWIDMCNEYDYIAISLSAQTGTDKWLKAHGYKPLIAFLKEAKKAGTKVHAMGCNNIAVLKKYHFYSTDSSTHTQGIRYGKVLRFRNEKVVDINDKRTSKVDREMVIDNNVRTMIEIANWAKNNI